MPSYRPPLKLAFADFWEGFEPRENYLFRLIDKHYEIDLEGKPDYLIYSGFGKTHRGYDCVKIFWTGENVRADMDACDYAFTSDYYDHPRHYRLPLYAYYHDPRDPGDPCHPERLTDPKPPVETLLARKKKFCCALISNGEPSERVRFLERLSRYKKVDSGSRAFNNLGYVVPQTIDGRSGKVEFIRDYKFVLSFENASYPGYTTEKLLEPMAVHSIPVYWGNPLAGRDFNTRSFVNCHEYKDYDEAIARIVAIDRDEAEYRAIMSEPWFHGNTVNEFVKEANVVNQFHRIIEFAPADVRRRRLRAAGWRALAQFTRNFESAS
jgi:hypothetical protein